MDANEIIKTAPAIAKGAAEIIAAVPIADIVKRICGPPADLLGEKLRERVERCFAKTAKMTLDAGITPQAVPPKLLFPILEGASLEEDENLHTMFAALLANAASPENTDEVRPGFIAILKQMAPDEGLLLNALYDSSLKTEDKLPADEKPISLFFTGGMIDEISESLGQDGFNCPICLDRLQSQFLLQRRFDSEHEVFLLTVSGRRFVAACRPPKPKS